MTARDLTETEKRWALNTALAAVEDFKKALAAANVRIEQLANELARLDGVCIAERRAAAALVAKDRASIVAFLTAEAIRFDDSAYVFDAMDKAEAADRCRTKAGHTRTLAAQIERVADLAGGTP